MATPRHGRNARIMIDMSAAGTGSATAVSAKNKWTLDQSVDFVDVTAFEDNNKSSVPGLPNAAGVISGHWDAADNSIYNLIGSTVARKFYLYPDVVNNVTTYFFTTAFFSVNESGGIGEAVDFNLNMNAASIAAWAHP